MQEQSERKSIRNPEQLDASIKISTPGVLAVVILGIIVLSGFLLWSIFGSINIKIDSKAWISDGVGVIYIPQDRIDEIDKTKEVLVEGAYHNITQISEKPFVIEELKTKLTEDVFYRLNPSENSYEIVFDAKKTSDGVWNASIITEKIRPLSFVF